MSAFPSARRRRNLKAGRRRRRRLGPGAGVGVVPRRRSSGDAVDWHHTEATSAASPIKHHAAIRKSPRRRGAPARPAVTARAPQHLHVCASTDIVVDVLERLTVSAEPERTRYAAVGRALADPKRLCVLELLAQGELSVGDLSARVGCQVPNMSQHLAVLRSAGLVITRKEGSTVFYRLSDPRVLEAYRLIQDIAR